MALSSLFIPSPFDALTNAQSVFHFDGVRFSLLTERLIRIEISPSNQFEDRPSQVFWYRNQTTPQAKIEYQAQNLKIETDHFILAYQETTNQKIQENISILIKKTGQSIQLNASNPGQLPGTTRTLDEVDGATELQPGLISRDGWVQIDDTSSLVFNPQGWLEERPDVKGYRDLYLLIYGSDYKAALQDYQHIAGTPPLLPRAFLGNWWSRYWPYSQEDITDLVNQFQQKEIPLSVLIIDMDWHITQTGNQCSGWTGFSWNHELFPDPEKMIHWLHEQKLITSMNLHPAEGIHAHEAQYKAASKAMDMDQSDINPIPFNIADPLFAKTYFEQLLYPLEKQGVDFWWLDWQQGESTALKGLDPLWWLNHLHFYDLGRSNVKRPIIFSRWGGAGNHRYPIGFSGDTIITWASLAFQPFFTASAANTAYGWWSHDIGGHMHGIEDGELYARWLQFGVVSPIMRLHCANDPWIDHLPWAYDAEIERISREAMQFRHALVPYLYTMSRRNEREGLPPITPLYYEWPHEEAAYQAQNQYLFGSEMMAAPVVSPIIPELKQARQPIWFPPGSWFDFFTGEEIHGNEWQVRLYCLDEIPLFARAGAIVPLQKNVTQNGCDNPDEIDLHVFSAGDGQFSLYEDDGVFQKYKTQGGCITGFDSKWTGKAHQFEIFPAVGDTSTISQERTFHIHFRGVREPSHVQIRLDGEEITLDATYDAATLTFLIPNIHMGHQQYLHISIDTNHDSLITPVPKSSMSIEQFLRRMPMKPDQKREIMNHLPALLLDIRNIKKLKMPMRKTQKIALIEEICGVAAAPLTSPTGQKHVVLCNPNQTAGFTCEVINPIDIPATGVLIEKNQSPIEINYFDIFNNKY
ncbi:MAG: DUF5110 domain-containing protein [Anaerolineaceae bacterium]|nr:DUF5110 domain-containing protein [Anaerolineaceae bacterium]